MIRTVLYLLFYFIGMAIAIDLEAVATTTMAQPTTKAPALTALITPLTTIFTPPCGAVIYESLMTEASCLAPDMSSVWANGGFYSPGVCPRGYTTDCVQTTHVGGKVVPLRPQETMGLCVPWGWTCFKDMNQNLAFFFDEPNVVFTAPAFEIRWKSSDIPAITGAYEHYPPGTPTTTYLELPTATDSEPASTDVTFRPSPIPKTSTSFVTRTIAGTAVVVGSDPTATQDPNAPTLSGPVSPTKEADTDDDKDDSMSSGELSGIVFGVCVGLLALVLAVWIVAKHVGDGTCCSGCGCCFPGGYSSEPRRSWYYNGQVQRIYSPSLGSRYSGSDAGPMRQAVILSNGRIDGLAVTQPGQSETMEVPAMVSSKDNPV